MANINVSRVLLAGLLAGLVINIGEFLLNTFVIAEQASAVMTELGLGALGTGQVAIFVVMAFIYGIVLAWIYAAIRPRFGAGLGTAVIAALTLWLPGWVLAGANNVIMGLFPLGLMVIAVGWGLIELLIAAALGAWAYREAEV